MEYWSKLSSNARKGIAILLGLLLLCIGILYSPHLFKKSAQNDEFVVSDEPTQITIYMTGAVNHPGVYTVPQGSRIQTGIKAAGGALSNWDPQGINLAKRLEDEDMVVVPLKMTSQSKPSRSTPQPEPTIAKKKLGETVKLNQANLEELETIPGVGPGMANRILLYRKTHGAFKSVEELRDIHGLGEKKYNRLKPYVQL